MYFSVSKSRIPQAWKSLLLSSVSYYPEEKKTAKVKSEKYAGLETILQRTLCTYVFK